MAGFGETYWLDHSTFDQTWLLSAQGRFFAAGSFEHGVFVGIEANYSSGHDHADRDFTRATVGPTLGYRRITSVGLALEGAAGLVRDLRSGRWLPVIHAGVGIAF